MAEEFWKQGTRSKADRIINDLLSAKKPEGWEGDFVLEFRLRVLSAMTKSLVSTFEILHILTEMHRQGKKGSAEFRRLYINEQEKSYHNRCKWVVCMPWYVEPDPWFTISFQITVGGVCFKVSGWDRYERRIKNSSLWSDLCEEPKRSNTVFGGLCLTAESSGSKAFEAWDGVAPAFYTFRGIVEWTFRFGQRKLSATPQPQGSVLHPSWAAMLPEERDPELLHFFFDCQSGTRTRITKGHVKQMQALARGFRKAPEKGSIDELLFDSLGLYSQAMDERIPSRALLAFWQLAEALTLAGNHNGRTDVVIKRSALVCQRYWKLNYEEILATLEVFADHRNGIVHEGGTGYIETDDCAYFKVVCDTMIAWMLRDRKKFPTKSILEQYYKLNSLPKEEIKGLRTALKYV